MNDRELEIRVSRRVMLIKMFMGLAFVLGGLVLAFPGRLCEFAIPEDRVHIFKALGGATVLIGFIIALPQAYYMCRPPVMMRATGDGIFFGTGRLYRLELLEWRHFKSVSVGTGPATSASTDQPIGSLEVIFKSAPGVPCSIRTPAGISYHNYVLSLNRFYMNRPVEAIVPAIREIHGKISGAGAGPDCKSLSG